jgi:hypothetical protein
MVRKFNHQILISFVCFVLIVRSGVFLFFESSALNLNSSKFNIIFLLTELPLIVVMMWVALRYRAEMLKRVSQILTKLTPRDLQIVNQPTPEIRAVINWLRSFVEQVSQFEPKRIAAKNTLPDGISHELSLTRKKLPYSIQAIVIRFSLSDGTRARLQEARIDLSKFLFGYFEQLKELRLRYGGLEYQFFGDENVLFFKVENGDQLEEQMLRAVAFLRDAFSIDNKLSPEVPRHFKAALVNGPLTLYEIAGNHYFFGSPLTESVKILAGITEQNRSIFALRTVNNEKVKRLCRPSPMSPGITMTQDSTAGFSCFDQFDQHFGPGKDPMHFLSDRGLGEILTVLVSCEESNNLEEFLLLFQKIMSVRTRVVSNEIILGYERLLIQTINKRKGVEVENKLLSCAVSLSWVFVPCGAENRRIKEELYNLIRHKDVRVASNALMASQRYEWNEETIAKMLISPSNRLRGDALLLLGRRGIEERFFKAWKQSVESKDPLFVLSALWASQEVFKFHRENNPSHLQSNEFVENMKELMHKLKQSLNKQITSRAQWALDAIVLNEISQGHQ